MSISYDSGPLEQLGLWFFPLFPSSNFPLRKRFSQESWRKNFPTLYREVDHSSTESRLWWTWRRATLLPLLEMFSCSALWTVSSWQPSAVRSFKKMHPGVFWAEMISLSQRLSKMLVLGESMLFSRKALDSNRAPLRGLFSETLLLTGIDFIMSVGFSCPILLLSMENRAEFHFFTGATSL